MRPGHRTLTGATLDVARPAVAAEGGWASPDPPSLPRTQSTLPAKLGVLGDMFAGFEGLPDVRRINLIFVLQGCPIGQPNLPGPFAKCELSTRGTHPPLALQRGEYPPQGQQEQACEVELRFREVLPTAAPPGCQQGAAQSGVVSARPHPPQLLCEVSTHAGHLLAVRTLHVQCSQTCFNAC